MTNLNVIGTNKKPNQRYDRERSLPEIKQSKSQKGGILKSHRDRNQAQASIDKETRVVGSIGVSGSQANLRDRERDRGNYHTDLKQ